MAIRKAIIVATCWLVGCSTSSLQPDVPALRTSVTPESLQEIEQTVSTAMNGAPVTIADDALTRDSMLLIERARSRSIDRPPELGRDLGRPERFQLIVDGRQCFLVQEASGLRWLLADTECVAANSSN